MAMDLTPNAQGILHVTEDNDADPADLAEITTQMASSIGAALGAKAAVVHTHAVSDVTGLQAALNGKAASSHGHAVSDVTGLQTALDSTQSAAAAANTNANGRVSKSGDTLTGALTLHGAPTNTLHAATKAYVDSASAAASAAAAAAQATANAALPKSGGTVVGPVTFQNNFVVTGGYTSFSGFTSTGLSEFDNTVNMKNTVGINRDAMGPHADFFDLDLMGVAPGGAALQQIKRASGATLRSYILATSTRRVKKNVKRATDVPDVTMLQPSVFQWKAAAPVPFAGEKERDQLGLIAEDVAEVDPRFVVHDDDDKPTALNVGALIAGLVAKVTELQTRLDALEQVR